MTEEINEPSHPLSLLVVTKNDDHQNDVITNDIFILARTSNEKLCFRTIQPALNKINIIIRSIQQNNVLCICHSDQWKQKMNTYMKETSCFLLIGDMTLEASNNHVEEILKKMSNEIVSTLHDLCLRKAITTEQYEQLMYFNQSTTFEINKLFFTPEIRHNTMSIQPMMTCYTKEPMKAIARFINILLAPLIERIIQSNHIFTTGSEVIQAFEKYAKQGYLQSTTLLVKIDIHDIYTSFPHHLFIDILQDFLHTYVPNGHIEGTSTITIVQLVKLILYNQFFLHENKLYQQTAGGSMSSPLTVTFVNLYLFYWYHDFVSILTNKQELFGKSLDQLVFTWNESKDELVNLINQKLLTNSNYAPVKVTTSIDQKIHYLDADISHYEGILHTRVYHDSNIEPYTLPPILETTPTQSHEFLIRAAFIRAILYCSNVDDFENERLYIELSFIINDATFNFIKQILQRILMEFNIYTGDLSIDTNTYQNLRQRIQQYHQQRIKRHIKQRQQRRRRRQRELVQIN